MNNEGLTSWQEFEKTGKIDAYLKYKGAVNNSFNNVQANVEAIHELPEDGHCAVGGVCDNLQRMSWEKGGEKYGNGRGSGSDNP